MKRSRWVPQENASLASSIASLPGTDRSRLLRRLTDDEATGLLYDWRFWARPKQLPPAGRWFLWLLRTGRQWGKTLTGAQWVRTQIEEEGRRSIALVSDTAADARDVMIEHPQSGILAVSPPWFRPIYEPTKRRLTWPNGAQARTFSAEDPEQLRGPQHDAAWCDELGKWKHQLETWDNLMFGLTLGLDPRCIITTTPRPTPLIKALSHRADVILTQGHTLENIDNLAPDVRERIIARYQGTRLGRQELAGELLEDVEGAMWQQAWIDEHRVREAPELARIVVAVDPAVTHGEDADETGVVVAGRGREPCSACSAAGYTRDYYVLSARGYRLSPRGWAGKAVDAFRQYGAGRIYAERNNGGDMVLDTIRSVWPGAPVELIVASKGKAVRAEPVAAKYEQGRVHHVGVFPELEEQMTTFPVANERDDILDATVYAITALGRSAPGIRWFE